jgi:hypothetical protein
MRRFLCSRRMRRALRRQMLFSSMSMQWSAKMQVDKKNAQQLSKN